MAKRRQIWKREVASGRRKKIGNVMGRHGRGAVKVMGDWSGPFDSIFRSACVVVACRGKEKKEVEKGLEVIE